MISEAIPAVTKRNVCGRTCEIYSRVCGYHRPTRNWNKGKRAEFADRKPFSFPPAAAKHPSVDGSTPSIESIKSINISEVHP
ncbi:MAG TPA: hypothetical protein DCZ94_21535 [Lentisphaeria bacterium]|nr:hypothetical protein [Lentisphaeria bacterium]